jgi:cell division protein FtsB
MDREELLKQIRVLEEENANLKEENANLKEENANLKEENANLKEEKGESDEDEYPLRARNPWASDAWKGK